MKTIVLDDDPTGTQSATGVTVLLDPRQDALLAALRAADTVYVQTNSRAVSEREAVRLVTTIRRAGLRAGKLLSQPVRFILRGDSTLRGHVFAESDVFASPSSVLLFVPAFPAGGRVTRDGTHFVRIGTEHLPAGHTEYARDPVFGFVSSTLAGYVAEKCHRAAVPVSLDALRASEGAAVADALAAAPPGAVVVPDAETDTDIVRIQRGLEKAWAARDIVVRCAAPLAAACAGVLSTSLLPRPLERPAGPVLLVCGSHTSGATAQLRELTRQVGCQLHTVPTSDALADPATTGRKLAKVAARTLESEGLACVVTEREREPAHGTLEHGQRVMAALSIAIRELAGQASAVVTKGGITSAEVIKTGFGAATARVRGQVLAGISVWDLSVSTRGTVPCVVIPGNVGDDHTLADIVQGVLAVRPAPPRTARPERPRC